MMEVESLPALNASLNSISTVLLVTGYFFIRRKNKIAHRNCMLAAFACSILFLTSYLIYHYYTRSTPFEGQGWVRPVYFFILITHIVLAALVPFLALATLYRAYREQWVKHRRIAKITFPIWLYVSVTGVTIYMMLYQMNFSS